MSIRGFLSDWVKSCLHSHALSVFSFVLILVGFCASGTMASAQAAYVQQCSSFGDYVESASCTLYWSGCRTCASDWRLCLRLSCADGQLLFRDAVEL